MQLSETTAGDLNDTATLIWFVSGDSVTKATELLEPLAKSYISKWSEEKTDPEMLFYVSGSDSKDDEIRDSLRTFAKLSTDDPQLVIVDIPDQKVTAHFNVAVNLSISHLRRGRGEGRSIHEPFEEGPGRGEE